MKHTVFASLGLVVLTLIGLGGFAVYSRNTGTASAESDLKGSMILRQDHVDNLRALESDYRRARRLQEVTTEQYRKELVRLQELYACKGCGLDNEAMTWRPAPVAPAAANGAAAPATAKETKQTK